MQNNGAAPELRVDGQPTRSALIRFDLSALPPGSHVVSAELHLWTTGQDQLKGQGTVRVYRMLEGWDEGRQNGSAGSASWNERQSGVHWTTTGAEQPGSRQASALGDIPATASNSRYYFALPTALVQGWIDTPATNDGLALVAQSTGDSSAAFESRESSSQAHRPEMIVTYSP
jgi:hypothetical protein